MNVVNVLVTSPAARPDVVDIIRAVDPRVRVVLETYEETITRRIARRAGRGAELEDLPMSPALLAALAEADVLVSSDLPSNLPALAPRVRWIQRLGAGVDHFRPGGGTGIWESDITLTTTGGFNSRAIAEFVMSFILGHAKQTRHYLQAQREIRWARQPSEALWDKTVAIVGLGRIGSATARLCKAFDMRVFASRRTLTQALPPNVDQMFSPDRLQEMLGQSDFVVLALPLTPETERSIGEREFSAMKPTAVFINVARGFLVDEQALLKALQSGAIAAACLDVLSEEPLPASSPLWSAPNITITPHASAAIATYGLEGAGEFAKNLRRYLRGEPLEGVVDRGRGY